MSKKNINIAVVGCSGMAKRHMEGVVAAEGATLYALCDTAPERLAELGEYFGCERLTADYRELVADPNVDAVVLEDHARNPILHGISLLSDYVISRAFAATLVCALVLGGGYFLYCYLGLDVRPKRGKYTRRR